MRPSAIFQRTETGRMEIQRKVHGLTQSERLVLIVTDGMTQQSDLKNKLKGLAESRFERALNNLVEKGLVFEVLMVPDHVEPEHFDPAAVDRFLQQDPLDPVTIVSFDAEDEFELNLLAEAGHRLPPVAVVPAVASQPIPHVVKRSAEGQASPVAPRITSVDFYIPLEKSSGMNSVCPTLIKVVDAFGAENEAIVSPNPLTTAAYAQARPHTRTQLWWQVLVGVGVVLLAASAYAKLFR